MPHLSLPLGHSIHFGAGKEHLQITVEDASITDSLITAKIAVQGTRQSLDQSLARVGPDYTVVSPAHEEKSDVLNELHVFKRIYSIQRDVRRHSDEMILEFLGCGDDAGDIKVEVSDLFTQSNDRGPSVQLFVNAAPRIPFARHSIHQRILHELSTGQNKTQQFTKVRGLYTAWLQKYADDLVTPNPASDRLSI
jgi:hypothetical protein